LRMHIIRQTYPSFKFLFHQLRAILIKGSFSRYRVFMKKTPKTPLPPELQALKRNANWQFYTMVILVVILGLLLALSLSGQAGLNQQINQNKKTIENSIALQQSLLTHLQQSLSKQESATDSAIQHLDDSLKQDNQSLLQRIAQQQSQQKQTLQRLSTQLTQSISELKAVETKIKNSADGTLPQASVDIHADKIAKGYRIYGVEPYGVVIQDPKGQFEIARIGKQLSLGIVTAITANAVHVGPWVITSLPEGANNTPALSKTQARPQAINHPVQRYSTPSANTRQVVRQRGAASMSSSPIHRRFIPTGS